MKLIFVSRIKRKLYRRKQTIFQNENVSRVVRYFSPYSFILLQYLREYAVNFSAA